MVFASLSLRLQVDVDAMNMVEPMGAYTRHRTIPMVKRRGKGRYTIVMAPAISGQSIAFAYQSALVELAKRMNMPLCNACENYRVVGGFIKQSGDVRGCVVEDITGFMVTVKGQVANRRTSTINFSYMLPDLEGASAHIEPQMHVRYNLVQPKDMQQPFEVEVATAVYTISVALDPERIGVVEVGALKQDQYVSRVDKVDDGERQKRVELAFDAFKVLFEGQVYGAKKSRVLPVTRILGAIAAVSDPMPFMVSPARVRSDTDHYINETLTRAKAYVETLSGETIYVVYMDKEDLTIDMPQLQGNDSQRLKISKGVNTFSELVDIIKGQVIRMLFPSTGKGG